MTLQREYREGGRLVWRDVVIDGQGVKSPVQSGVTQSGVLIGNATAKGYNRADLWDAWERYL